MNVVLVAVAERDLERIGDASWSEHGAARTLKLLKDLRKSCESLADMAERYPLVPRHERSGIRRRLHGPFLIFYTIETDVRILRILHGAMDWEPIVFPLD